MNQPYAPTEPIPFDRRTPLVEPWHDEIPTRIDPFSRDDCALLIDFYLRRLVSLKNRIDPGLAAGLARMRDGEKHRLLGFVRMKDYTEECLDLDWRRARYLLTIHDAFRGMPLLAGSFENGRLSWTKAREITSVADAETQGRWLDFASATTVRLLAGAVRRFKADGRLPWDEDTPAVPVEDVPAADPGQEGEGGGSAQHRTIADDRKLADDLNIAQDLNMMHDRNIADDGNIAQDLNMAHDRRTADDKTCRDTATGSTGTAGAVDLDAAGRPCIAGRFRTTEDNVIAENVSDSTFFTAASKDDLEDRPWPTFSCRVPPALRRRWEEAVEACRRQSSAETPLWECAEYMAAEILDTVSGLELEDGAPGQISGAPGGRNKSRGGGPAGDGQARPGNDNSANSDPAHSDPAHSDPARSDPSDRCEADRQNSGIHTPTTDDTPGHCQHPGAASDADRDLVRAGIEQETGNWSFLSWAPMVVTLVGQLEADLRLVKYAAAEASGREGARDLHRALLRLVGYHEKIERYLGRLLRFFGDHRFHQRCQFLSLRHYARERLGLSARQVGYLTSRERVFIHHPELEEAFLDGRVGSAKVRLLEPFARQVWPCDWKAWIERAERVTVRRLADEASWAVDYCQRDSSAWQKRNGTPPAPGEGPYARVDGGWHICSGDSQGGSAGDVMGAELAGAFTSPGTEPEGTAVGRRLACPDIDEGPYARVDDRWHTCSSPAEGSAGQAAGNGDTICPAPGVLPDDQAPGAGECDPPLTSLIRFSAPPESAAVWSRAVKACSRLAGDNAPPWRCLEMIVDHFLLVWAPQRDPEHLTTGYPNAVFQRDGWRCTVPGCRARSNLTPHHIVKRSRGGGDEPANLTTVCFHHHLEGIHRGVVSVEGRAPDQLVWELGRKAGEVSILAAGGDWVFGRWTASAITGSTSPPPGVPPCAGQRVSQVAAHGGAAEHPHHVVPAARGQVPAGRYPAIAPAGFTPPRTEQPCGVG